MIESIAEPTTKKRLYFLDNLKAFIIILVVLFHVAIGYTHWNLSWWFVNDIEQHTFFDLFGFQVDVYLMPIMFLIAGYFAAPALFNKNIIKFWKSKLRRVIIPWILGVLFITPIIAYAIPFSRMDNPPSFLDNTFNNFFGPYFFQAHFWFLGMLTLFFLLLTIAYQINPTYFKKPPQKSTPSLWFLVFFALFSAVPYFVTNLFIHHDLWYTKTYILFFQPVRLGLYACYFGLGVYAWQHAWFTLEGYKPHLVGWVSSMIIIMFVYVAHRIAFTLAPDVPVLHKAVHAILFSIFSLTTTLGLISFFYRFINSDAYFWRRLSANSFTIYLIHQCVVIPLALMMQKIQLNVFVKYLGVSITSLVLCFLISEYIINPILTSRKKDKISSSSSIAN